MNTDSKLWRSLTGSNGRTDLSRRRQAEQYEQSTFATATTPSATTPISAKEGLT